MREKWDAVDRYLGDLLIPPDPALDAALEASDTAGLPAIAVSPAHGKLLFLLAQAIQAKRVLEIGTLGGYSTIWLARGLAPGGRLITLEIDPGYASVASANLARAGLADRVEVRVGPARESLRRLASEGADPFDLVFIDADKEGYPEYLALALALVRRGSLIIADNVVRDGAVVDSRSADPKVQGARRFHEMLAADARLSATVIQTVGSKGYDGFALARVTADTHAP